MKSYLRIKPVGTKKYIVQEYTRYMREAHSSEYGLSSSELRKKMESEGRGSIRMDELVSKVLRGEII